MKGALAVAVLTVFKCSGVDCFLYTCRFGQWVRLWAGMIDQMTNQPP